MNRRFRSCWGCTLLLALAFGCGGASRTAARDDEGDAGAAAAEAGGESSTQGGSRGGGGGKGGAGRAGGGSVEGGAGQVGGSGDGGVSFEGGGESGTESGGAGAGGVDSGGAGAGGASEAGTGQGGSDGTCSDANGCCALPAVDKLVVDIIESESLNAGHEMDIKWLAVAQGLGFTATIRPQTFLDDVVNLKDTNVLVVSSGLIDLPVGRVATIQSFMLAGGGVYLQGEYLTSYSPNQAFSQIVNANGGSFVWGSTVSGALEPVQVLGCWANTAEPVASLNYFWYGATATTTAEAIVKNSGGVPLGWSWCVPGPGNGQIVQLTDQDAFSKASAEDNAFMHNILIRLAFASSCD